MSQPSTAFFLNFPFLWLTQLNSWPLLTLCLDLTYLIPLLWVAVMVFCDLEMRHRCILRAWNWRMENSFGFLIWSECLCMWVLLYKCVSFIPHLLLVIFASVSDNLNNFLQSEEWLYSYRSYNFRIFIKCENVDIRTASNQ